MIRRILDPVVQALKRRQPRLRYHLYDAVRLGIVSIDDVIGHGSTVGLTLMLTNQTNENIEVIIEAGTAFIDETGQYQRMMVIRPRSVPIDARQTVTVEVYALCIDARLEQPPPKDELNLLFYLMNRLARDPQYREMTRDELNRMSLALMHKYTTRMYSYRLAPLPPELADQLTHINQAVATLDGQIQSCCETARQSTASFSNRYGGQKRLVSLLVLLSQEESNAINEPSSLLTGLFLRDLDSLLPVRVFTSSSYVFQKSEALGLIDFGKPPEDLTWQDEAQLATAAIQHAIWGVTDGHRLADLRMAIQRTAEDEAVDDVATRVRVLAAGIRSLLRTANLPEYAAQFETRPSLLILSD